MVFTNKGNWSCELYYIRYAVQDGFVRTIDSLQYQKYTLQGPRSGWPAFMDSATWYGLFTLPNCTYVPGYGEDLHTDELSYYVEIASNNYYRMYGYCDPFARAEKFKEAKKLTQIIKLIKREFVFPEPFTPKTEKGK